VCGSAFESGTMEAEERAPVRPIAATLVAALVALAAFLIYQRLRELRA
jgi:hypothetical protein